MRHSRPAPAARKRQRRNAVAVLSQRPALPGDADSRNGTRPGIPASSSPARAAAQSAQRPGPVDLGSTCADGMAIIWSATESSSLACGLMMTTRARLRRAILAKPAAG